MKHPWLTLLSFAAIGTAVLVIYAVSLQPVEYAPSNNQEQPTLDEPTVTYVNPSKGPADADVTVIEFGDFQCAHCRDVADHLDAILETYPEKVRVVWKHMPNDSTHPQAVDASVAAQCAKEQGRFWPYHDALFANQQALSEPLYAQIAQNLNLNIDQFQACFDARDTLPIVQKDIDEGLALQLTATPTLFIDGERHVGAMSRQQVLSLVQQALAQKTNE